MIAGRTIAVPEPASAGLTLRGVVAAVPDFALAGSFLITWIRPEAFGRTAVPYFLLTMLLEFIVVHSSGFMENLVVARASAAHRVQGIVVLSLFYTIFVGAFALGFKSWWPLYAFWGLTLNRTLRILLGDTPADRARQYVQAGWALSVAYYVGGVFVTALLPMPELGITREVRMALHLPGHGLWIDEPQRVLAFGVFYFGLTGLGEALGWARSGKFPRRSVPANG